MKCDHRQGSAPELHPLWKNRILSSSVARKPADTAGPITLTLTNSLWFSTSLSLFDPSLPDLSPPTPRLIFPLNVESSLHKWELSTEFSLLSVIPAFPASGNVWLFYLWCSAGCLSHSSQEITGKLLPEAVVLVGVSTTEWVWPTASLERGQFLFPCHTDSCTWLPHKMMQWETQEKESKHIVTSPKVMPVSFVAFS